MTEAIIRPLTGFDLYNISSYNTGGNMSVTELEGMVWKSMLYEPDDVIDYAGPDRNLRCESPRHKLGEFRPPAEWLEMWWRPEAQTVARAWKTCEACHVAMAAVAERTS